MSADLGTAIADVIRAEDKAWPTFRAARDELATVTWRDVVRHPIAYWNLWRATAAFKDLLQDPTVYMDDGTIVARVTDGSLSGLDHVLQPPTADAVRVGSRRFTAFVRWGDREDPTEEIDVDAINARMAEECAYRELTLAYRPGGTIVGVEERTGWYM